MVLTRRDIENSLRHSFVARSVKGRRQGRRPRIKWEEYVIGGAGKIGDD